MATTIVTASGLTTLSQPRWGPSLRLTPSGGVQLTQGEAHNAQEVRGCGFTVFSDLLIGYADEGLRREGEDC